ncbi:hypothetical protein CMUS01_16116, partial [Colletotrichum musicola]
MHRTALATYWRPVATPVMNNNGSEENSPSDYWTLAMNHHQYDFASTDPGVKLNAGTGAQSSYKESSLFHKLDAPSAFSNPVAAAFGELDPNSLCQFADFISLSINPEMLSNLDWSSPAKGLAWAYST